MIYTSAVTSSTDLSKSNFIPRLQAAVVTPRIAGSCKSCKSICRASGIWTLFRSFLIGLWTFCDVVVVPPALLNAAGIVSVRQGPGAAPVVPPQRTGALWVFDTRRVLPLPPSPLPLATMLCSHNISNPAVDGDRKSHRQTSKLRMTRAPRCNAQTRLLGDLSPVAL